MAGLLVGGWMRTDTKLSEEGAVGSVSCGGSTGGRGVSTGGLLGERSANIWIWALMYIDQICFYQTWLFHLGVPETLVFQWWLLARGEVNHQNSKWWWRRRQGTYVRMVMMIVSLNTSASRMDFSYICVHDDRDDEYATAFDNLSPDTSTSLAPGGLCPVFFEHVVPHCQAHWR